MHYFGVSNTPVDIFEESEQHKTTLAYHEHKETPCLTLLLSFLLLIGSCCTFAVEVLYI